MQGVQTFYTTNHDIARPEDFAAHNESWGSYPDANPVRSFYAGDPRAAIAPFQAYQWVPSSFLWKVEGLFRQV